MIGAPGPPALVFRVLVWPRGHRVGGTRARIPGVWLVPPARRGVRSDDARPTTQEVAATLAQHPGRALGAASVTGDGAPWPPALVFRVLVWPWGTGEGGTPALVFRVCGLCLPPDATRLAGFSVEDWKKAVLHRLILADHTKEDQCRKYAGLKERRDQQEANWLLKIRLLLARI